MLYFTFYDFFPATVSQGKYALCNSAFTLKAKDVANLELKLYVFQSHYQNMNSYLKAKLST